MGSRGPKPTPTPVLKLRQSWRGKTRSTEPSFDQRRPQKPMWLIGEGKKLWEKLVPILHRAGLASQVNRETLAMLCDSWARYREACEKLDKEGAVLVSVNQKGGDYEYQSPWMSIRNTMFDQVKKMAACYGMTPADIANVRATEKPSGDSKKSKFFGSAG